MGERAVYARVVEEAGQQLADLLMSPPGRRGHSPWLGVSSNAYRLHLDLRWEAENTGGSRRKKFSFTSEEEAAAFHFVSHKLHAFEQLQRLRTSYRPLVLMRQHAQRLAIVPLACRARYPARDRPSGAGRGPALLAALLQEDWVRAAMRPQRQPGQQRGEEAMLMGRLRSYVKRGAAGLATLTPDQMLLVEGQLPVTRHALCGLTQTKACSMLRDLAVIAGLAHWWQGHLDHVWPVALLCFQLQLPLVCTLLGLRVLSAEENRERGSLGLARVQGQADSELREQLRRLPGGELESAVVSSQTLKEVKAEAEQHEAQMRECIAALNPGPCPCGPCRVDAAPDQPLETREQAAEVALQQLQRLWSCMCACLRRRLGVQLWQVGRHLQHGGTGQPEEPRVPLMPPTDGSGAGMDAQLAEQMAREGVALYMDQAARAGARACQQPQSHEQNELVRQRLEAYLLRVLVAPRAGAGTEEEREEEERELAWAAMADGREEEARRRLAAAEARQGQEAAEAPRGQEAAEAPQGQEAAEAPQGQAGDARQRAIAIVQRRRAEQAQRPPQERQPLQPPSRRRRPPAQGPPPAKRQPPAQRPQVEETEEQRLLRARLRATADAVLRFSPFARGT